MLRQFTENNHAPSKLLVVTHSSIIRKLIVLDEQTNSAKIKKFRVFTQHTEMYPYSFEFYDNIISDAREKDLIREPRIKVPKVKKADTDEAKKGKSPSKKNRQAAASASPDQDDASKKEKVAPPSKSKSPKTLPENNYMPGGSSKYGIRAGAPFFCNESKQGERSSSSKGRARKPESARGANKQFVTPDQ